MKQLFYAIAAIIVLFFAIRLMAKVKDVPVEEPEHFENDEEDTDVIDEKN